MKLYGITTGAGRRRPMHPVDDDQRLRIRDALAGLELTDSAAA